MKAHRVGSSGIPEPADEAFAGRQYGEGHRCPRHRSRRPPVRQQVVSELVDPDHDRLDDQRGAAPTQESAAGLDKGGGDRADELEREIGGGHPVRSQRPGRDGTADDVDQGGQDPGVHAAVGGGHLRGHPDAHPGARIGGGFGLQAEITEQVLRRRVSGERHSATPTSRAMPGPGVIGSTTLTASASNRMRHGRVPCPVGDGPGGPDLSDAV